MQNIFQMIYYVNENNSKSRTMSIISIDNMEDAKCLISQNFLFKKLWGIC